MTWKQPFTGSWSLARGLRLGMGVLALGSSIVDAEPYIGIIGGVLLLQSAYNFGCGLIPGASCTVEQSNNLSSTPTASKSNGNV